MLPVTKAHLANIGILKYNKGLPFIRMKNKKLTYYVLIPAVIIIWGIIIYKIRVKDDDNAKLAALANTHKKEKSVSEKDVYQLINNYADPFISELHQTKEALILDLNDAAKPKIENKWPEIRFNGYVLNGKKMKCHLTINGEDKILQEHDSILKDCIVSAITSDSVKIIYLENFRWFKK